MVQRRGSEIGGEAAELGRMAGEQEAALRSLVLGGRIPVPRGAEDDPETTGQDGGPPGPSDLRALLAGYAGAAVTVSAPAEPVLLPPDAARQVAAAVGAALDNVTPARRRRRARLDPRRGRAGRGAGQRARRRPRLSERSLADAEREGRLGVAQSIRGRLRDLGGSAEFVSVPGQGTEVELRVPRGKNAKQGRADPAAGRG